MFEICVKLRFSAAHRLAGYEGNCANLHGHNWDTEIFVRGEELDKLGFLADFRKIKKVADVTLGRLDHADLNEVPGLAGRNPTSEHLAQYLYDALSAALDCAQYRVHRVCVRETPETAACYGPEL